MTKKLTARLFASLLIVVLLLGSGTSVSASEPKMPGNLALTDLALGLPFKSGEWLWSQGPHVAYSLDLASSQTAKEIVSAAPGYVHITCGPDKYGLYIVRVLHMPKDSQAISGYATTYVHVQTPTVRTGQYVADRITVLGKTKQPPKGSSFATNCGTSYGAHVHWGLFKWTGTRDASGKLSFSSVKYSEIGWNNMYVGGWRIQQREVTSSELRLKDNSTKSKCISGRTQWVMTWRDKQTIRCVGSMIWSKSLAGDGGGPAAPTMLFPTSAATVFLLGAETFPALQLNPIAASPFNPILGYDVEVGYSNGVSSISKTFSSNKLPLQITLSGLDLNPKRQTLQIRTRARNLNGTGNWSAFVQVPVIVADANSTYRIISLAEYPDGGTNKVLDVKDRSTQNGAVVQVWDWSGSNNANQIWMIVPVAQNQPGSEYWFVSLSSRKCLDVENWSTENGARLQQYDCHLGANQKFIFENHFPALSQSYRTIKSVHSQKYLDVNIALGNGDHVQQWELGSLNAINENKKWEIEPASIVDSCTLSGMDSLEAGCIPPTIPPSRTVTASPTGTATASPTATRTTTATATPTAWASDTPTATETALPIESPTDTPVVVSPETPTDSPTPESITDTPTWTPTGVDTLTPSFTPSFTPSPTYTPASISLTKTVVVNASQDAYAQSNYPTSAAGNTRNVYLGYDTAYGKYKNRIYIRFNLPALPSGYQVTGAQIEIYQYVTECSSNYAVTAYDIPYNWSESTLTWNNQPGKGASKGSATIGCSLGWKSIPITTIVKEWYQGYRNYGVTIWLNTETYPGGIFWSKECGTNCPNSEFPRLRITYTYPVTVTPKP